MNYRKTNQEKFWISEFGDDYVDRNLYHKESIKRNFAKILIKNNIEIDSCIEFGSNVGINLDALKELYSGISTFGVEINKKAYEILIQNHNGFHGSVYNFSSSKKYDLTLSAGVLIMLTNWKMMNLLCIPFLIIIILTTLRADILSKK